MKDVGLFISDIHATLRLPMAKVDPGNESSDRLRDTVDVMQQLTDYAEQVGAKFIGIAGDLFDAAHPDGQTLIATSSALHRMSRVCPVYLLSGNHDCNPASTELLTKRGWLKYDEILDTDQVLSFNPETQVAEWVGIDAKIVREHDGELITYGEGQWHLTATPNHRVLGRVDNTCRWDFRQLKNLPGSYEIPVSGSSEATGVDLTDDQIALAGWFFTDASLQFAGNSPSVVFYQSKIEHIETIRGLLLALDLKHRESQRDRDIKEICGKVLKKKPLVGFEFALTAESGRKILSWTGRDREKLPSWVHEMSDEQADIFINAVVSANGTWDGKYPENKTCAAIHGKKQILDELQSVFVQHGWRCRISQNNRGHYVLNVLRKKTVRLSKERCRDHYKGIVWCLTVKNGNFMVREDGAAFFSGNCLGRTGTIYNLQFYNELALDNLIVCGHEHYEIQPGLKLHAMPWLPEELAMHRIRERSKKLSKGDKHILMFHQGVKGALYDSGMPSEDGVDDSFAESFTAGITGHYHRPQKFISGQYLGAPFDMRFGDELIEERGFWEMDLNSKTLETKMIPTKYPKFGTMKIEMRSGDALDDMVSPDQVAAIGEYARIILSGPPDTLNEQTHAIHHHRRLFPGRALKFDLRPDREIQSRLDTGKEAPPDSEDRQNVSIEQMMELYVSKFAPSDVSSEEILNVGRQMLEGA